MSEQFTMFDQKTSKDIPSATSSPESESGATLSGAPVGQTKGKPGLDRVPASRSARPAKARRSTTKGIFGQSSFDSSKHDDLSFALASKLRPLTDSLGSTLYRLTWITRATPAGRWISALRASELRTGDSVCIGWPTPQKHDERERGNTMADHHYWPHDLSNAVMMAAWPTTTAEDAESSGMRHARGVADTLTAVASLAGWPTPKKADGEQGSETMMRGNLTLLGQARLGAWPTPMAQTPAQGGYNEAGNSDSSRKTVALCQWPLDPSMGFGDKPIGFLLGRNGWEIVPACGQLNAAHSRWLMGLPNVWDDSGVTAIASLRKRRKRL